MPLGSFSLYTKTCNYNHQTYSILQLVQLQGIVSLHVYRLSKCYLQEWS